MAPKHEGEGLKVLLLNNRFPIKINWVFVMWLYPEFDYG
jgi:hypothetical protein